ncbi:MAG: DUF3078 domain-containing protein [Bacteroidota bacterium]
MKLVLLSLGLFVGIVAHGQDTLKKPSNWQLKAIYSLNATQTAFVNWSAGGRNNISLLASISANANYKKESWSWTNDLSLALGGLKYISKGNNEGLQKTDDRIDFSSNIGYKIKDKVYFSAIGGLKTQMLDGFAYPNDSVRVSTFFAPGYINLAIGIDWIPNTEFSLFTSPLAGKITIVKDQTLANAGAFGVTGATYDGLGTLLTKGANIRYEFGAYIKAKYTKTLAKNIDLKAKLELFSNYLNNPQNIDVNAEALFSFKINSWFAASLQWNLIYDDDIDIRDSEGNVGPRTQFLSVLGLGITYKMENNKKE